jgi:hypothetical protein
MVSACRPVGLLVHAASGRQGGSTGQRGDRRSETEFGDQTGPPDGPGVQGRRCSGQTRCGGRLSTDLSTGVSTDSTGIRYLVTSLTQATCTQELMAYPIRR